VPRKREGRRHQPGISANGARKKERRRGARFSATPTRRGDVPPCPTFRFFFLLVPLCGESTWCEFGRPQTDAIVKVAAISRGARHFRMIHSGGRLLGGIEAGISIPRATVRTPVRKTDPRDDDRGGNVGHKSGRATYYSRRRTLRRHCRSELTDTTRGEYIRKP